MQLQKQSQTTHYPLFKDLINLFKNFYQREGSSHFLPDFMVLLLAVNTIVIEENINLASAMYLGTLDMLSIPPATTTSFIPNQMLCAANMVVAVTKNACYKRQEIFDQI